MAWPITLAILGLPLFFFGGLFIIIDAAEDDVKPWPVIVGMTGLVLCAVAAGMAA